MLSRLFLPINVTVSGTCIKRSEVSHNEVHAFGSEPCRLCQLALHAVFYSVFLTVFLQ